MDKTIVVNGMHCESCSQLIKMELEDAGLGEKIASIETGLIKLRDVDDRELQSAISAINNSSEYKVESYG